MENQVKFFTKFNTIYLIVSTLIPLAIGGIALLITEYLGVFEAAYVLIGLIDLLIITIRLHARDSRNYKKNKSIVEDKTTKDYKEWKNFQYLLGLAGAIDLLLSLVAFVIRINV